MFPVLLRTADEGLRIKTFSMELLLNLCYKNSIDNEASFLNVSMDMLCLQVAQLSRSPDLAIFHGADRQIDVQQTDHRSDCFIPCACTGHRSVRLSCSIIK